MENTFWTALVTSTLAALVTSTGIFTIRRFSDWGHRNTTYFICFAAGVLIAASFLHIIPKSIAMNPQASVWLLVGFLSLHLFNRFLTAFVCEKDPDSKEYAIGVVPMLGIGFHSFIDGFIYSIGCRNSGDHQAIASKKVAPGHCTGDEAIRMFHGAWAETSTRAGGCQFSSSSSGRGHRREEGEGRFEIERPSIKVFYAR